jgi:hypothetical protein
VRVVVLKENSVGGQTHTHLKSINSRRQKKMSLSENGKIPE